MMYYIISKNEENHFFGKKIAQVWAVTLSSSGPERPSTVSACSHLGDLYSLCIPKRIRTIFKVTRSFKYTGDKLFRILKSF